MLKLDKYNWLWNLCSSHYGNCQLAAVNLASDFTEFELICVCMQFEANDEKLRYLLCVKI